MGRIRFITLKVELRESGYIVAVSVFDAKEVIHRDHYVALSWREALQVIDAVTEHFRPGLELMAGGIQLSMFD